MYNDIKQVRHPATCRELYFSWIKLCPEIVNTAVANVIKSIRIHVGAAYFIPAYLAM